MKTIYIKLVKGLWCRITAIVSVRVEFCFFWFSHLNWVLLQVKIKKTSPQSKCHKLSLLFHFISFYDNIIFVTISYNLAKSISISYVQAYDPWHPHVHFSPSFPSVVAGEVTMGLSQDNDYPGCAGWPLYPPPMVTIPQWPLPTTIPQWPPPSPSSLAHVF